MSESIDSGDKMTIALNEWKIKQNDMLKTMAVIRNNTNTVIQQKQGQQKELRDLMEGKKARQLSIDANVDVSTDVTISWDDMKKVEADPDLSTVPLDNIDAKHIGGSFFQFNTDYIINTESKHTYKIEKQLKGDNNFILKGGKIFYNKNVYKFNSEVEEYESVEKDVPNDPAFEIIPNLSNETVIKGSGHNLVYTDRRKITSTSTINNNNIILRDNKIFEVINSYQNGDNRSQGNRLLQSNGVKLFEDKHIGRMKITNSFNQSYFDLFTNLEFSNDNEWVLAEGPNGMYVIDITTGEIQKFYKDNDAETTDNAQYRYSHKNHFHDKEEGLLINSNVGGNPIYNSSNTGIALGKCELLKEGTDVMIDYQNFEKQLKENGLTVSILWQEGQTYVLVFNKIDGGQNIVPIFIDSKHGEKLYLDLTGLTVGNDDENIDTLHYTEKHGKWLKFFSSKKNKVSLY